MAFSRSPHDQSDEEEEPLTAEEEMMKQIMGFAKFDSTKVNMFIYT